MFIGMFAQTKWREPFLVGRCLGAAENVRFIGCYGGSKPPPYGFVRKSNSPTNQNLNAKSPQTRRLLALRQTYCGSSYLPRYF